MNPILMIISMSCEAPKSVRGILHMAREMAKHGAKIEIVALSSGIQLFDKNGEHVGTFGPLLKELQGLGIRLAACTNAMKTFELTERDMLPVDTFVIGGEEVLAKTRYGYQVMTF